MQERQSSELLKVQRARKAWLNRRLFGYTATAGAALAVAGTANATIQYDKGFAGPITENSANSPVSFSLTGGLPNQFNLLGTALLDLASSHIKRPRIILAALRPGSQPGPGPQTNGGPSAQTSFLPGNGVLAYAVAGKFPIGANWNVLGSSRLTLASKAFTAHGTTAAGGSFLGKEGYIGVKFEDPNNSNQTDYGWVDAAAASDVSSATIFGWAYDDSGAPILAGDTGVPEPSSLAIWALGALTSAGACVLRRWKKQD